jgi:hypothetical protein
MKTVVKFDNTNIAERSFYESNDRL